MAGQWNYPPYPGGNETLVSDDFMSLLSNLSKDELEELMNNEDKINEIVCDQEKVKKIKLDIELIQAENRSLADHTIEKEPLLDDLRNTLTTKYENIRQFKEIFQLNQAKLESLQKNVNLEAMLNVLQAKCAMSEEKAEEVAEKFYNGSVPLAEFLEQFKQRKTEAHLRRIKTDKMRELVLDVQRHSNLPASLPSISSPSTAAYPSRPPPHAGGGPGYPPSSYGMPSYPPQTRQNPYKWN